MSNLNNKFRFSVSTGAVKLLPFNEVLESFHINQLQSFAFNITPIVNGSLDIENAKSLIKDFKMHCSIIEGGWCNFINNEEFNKKTIDSIAKQVSIARYLKVKKIRLFFGVDMGDISEKKINDCSNNILKICNKYKDIEFFFENEKGLSSNLNFLNSIVKKVSIDNFGINFDTVNFELNDVDPLIAYKKLKKKIAHFHVKGKYRNMLIEYGSGDSKVDDIIRLALKDNEILSVSIEYEGPKDRLKTLIISTHLFQERIANGFFI